MAPRLPLTPNQKRVRVMIFSFPVLLVTSYTLYRRLYLGEEQKQLKPGESIFALGKEEVEQ